MNLFTFPSRSLWIPLAGKIVMLLGILSACTGDRYEPNPENILFLGNSITYGGRYVDYIETAFILQEQAHEIGVIDLGLSSETISCLSEQDHPFPRPCVLGRLDACLDSIRPDQVVACYGMNCGIYHPLDSNRLLAFQQGIETLIESCQKRGIALTLLTPPPFAETLVQEFPTPDSLGYSYKAPFPQYDAVLRRYADWILGLNETTDVQVVDIRTPLLDHLNQSYSERDVIHPNATGHAIIGETILDAWNRPIFPQVLDTGFDQTQQDEVWQAIEQLVKKERETYDRAMLSHIGHEHPGIGKKGAAVGRGYRGVGATGARARKATEGSFPKVILPGGSQKRISFFRPSFLPSCPKVTSMVPIRLSLEGLYSYQKKQVIDFERLTQAQLFGIFGATGSGKSSILEAITLALYGECERLNRNLRNFNLMNLRSDKLTVDLEFSLSGREEDRYRFVVSGKRNTKQFEKIQYQRKAYQKQGDTWNPLDLPTAESLIGLGYEHFKRTIIIPQGKFREFLDMKDRDRSDMLNQVFGLDKYRLSPQVKQLIQRNEMRIAEHRALIQQYLELNDEGVQALKESINQREKELVDRQKELEEKRSLHTEWEKRKVLHQQYQNLQEQLSRLQADKTTFAQREQNYQDYVQCLNLFREPLNKQKEYGIEIQSYLHSLTAEKQLLDTLTQEVQQQKNSLEEIQKAYGERHQLEEKKEEWKKIIALKKEEAFLYEHLEGRRKKGEELVAKLQENIGNLKSDFGTTEKAIATLKAQQPATQAMLAVQKWVQQKVYIQEQVRQAEARKAVLEDEVADSLKKKRDLLQDSFIDARQYDLPSVQITALFHKEIERISTQIQQVDEKREQMLITHKLENLSESLVEGEPCPLCGATHHPHPLNASKLDRELKDLEKFKGKLREKISKLEGAAPLLMELAEQAIGIKRRGHEVEERLSELKQQLGQIEATRPVLKEDWEEGKVSAMRLQFEEIDQQLKEKEVSLQALKSRISDEEGKLTTYQKTLKDIQQQYSEKHGEFSSRKQSLRHLLFDEQRQHSDTYLQEQAVQAERDFEEIGKLFRQVSEQAEFKQNQLKLQEGKLQSIQETYKSLTQKSARLTQEIQAILEDSAFETLEQVHTILSLHLNIDAEREAIQSYQKELVGTEGQVRELEQQMGNIPYEEEAHRALTQSLQQLEDSYDAFFQELGIQKHSLDQMVQDLHKKQQLQKQLDGLQDREENLKIMQNLFRGDAFVKYVSSAYLENLCAAANDRFMRLTRNALSLEIDEHNQFHIRDWLNDGKLRSVRTLSGGQSFQAALCLALALSDQVQQQVQAQQRFFFLDEGFGALDKESLRLIFFTLQQLQKENRIVGIISHVEELQQEIDTYLHIHNDPELGSQVAGSWEA